jgi:hypothetical protein
MSSNREPVQIVEIDLDYCSLTYGTLPCTAVLGTSGVRKCYNTYKTCQVQSVFTKTTKTYKFAAPRANFPVSIGNYFPVLNSVSAISTTVNIAGSDESLNAFGRRATVTISLQDFPYDDQLTDKYRDQRIDGTAQTDEGGYQPKDRGTFFTKLRARNPYYVGRPLRILDGYMDDGTLSGTRTRGYIITNMTGPDSDGNVTIEAKDILALADDKKAVAPTAARGNLLANITAVDTTLTLQPTGIGDLEYAASGYAVVGSEIVTFTRAADVVTLTGRGLRGTVAASHNALDTFQQAIDYSHQRVDDVIYDLLVNYAKIPSSYIDFTAWQDEVTTWMASLFLDTTITSPTGVNTLIGELAVLGISIWWDDVNQKIGLKANRPLYNDVPTSITDRDNIKDIDYEDHDQYRLTQVHFYSVQSDPTKSVSSKDNYNRLVVTIDTTSENVLAYGDTRVREITCRWLNVGSDAVTGILSRRLLKRFNTAPATYKILLDAKDRTLALADVITVNSRVVTDDTGNPVDTNLQIIKLVESNYGHEVEVTAQAYQYDGRYARVMSAGANDYPTSTALEKSKGGYICGGTYTAPTDFADGTTPYVMI